MIQADQYFRQQPICHTAPPQARTKLGCPLRIRKKRKKRVQENEPRATNKCPVITDFKGYRSNVINSVDRKITSPEHQKQMHNWEEI